MGSAPTDYLIQVSAPVYYDSLVSQQAASFYEQGSKVPGDDAPPNSLYTSGVIASGSVLTGSPTAMEPTKPRPVATALPHDLLRNYINFGSLL